MSPARSGVRSAAGASKRSSSTLCTTVPRTASGDGGSGSRSMVRKRYIRGQAMKSPARLGEIAPSTSTPSTGVEIRSAGDSGAVVVAGAGRGIDMTRLTLGGATDSGGRHGGRSYGQAPAVGGVR